MLVVFGILINASQSLRGLANRRQVSFFCEGAIITVIVHYEPLRPIVQHSVRPAYKRYQNTETKLIAFSDDLTHLCENMSLRRYSILEKPYISKANQSSRFLGECFTYNLRLKFFDPMLKSLKKIA